MTEQSEPSTTVALTWWQTKGPIICALAFFASPLFIWMGLRAMENNHLSPCDDAIKAQLIAPATYERIASSGIGNMHSITYDADNAFGVPIRASGNCWIEGDTATWSPDPRHTIR